MSMMNDPWQDYRELLIGCGNSREKRLIPPNIPATGVDRTRWQSLTTLDVDLACKPDIVCDLSRVDWQGNFIVDQLTSDKGFPAVHSRGEEQEPLLRSSYFDEIHAYEVLEHCGRQGDFKLFFAQFREFWRILKADGYLCATVPDWRSVWAWGDPSHTRVINEGTLVFLSKAQYAAQVGVTAMSDFRELLTPADFQIVGVNHVHDQFQFVLRALK